MDAVKRTQRLASAVLIVTALVLALLLVRVVWLEKHVTMAMQDQINRQVNTTIRIDSWRGGIRFEDGTPAAISVRTYNLFADPAFIVEPKGYRVKIDKLETQLEKASPDEKANIQRQIDDLKKQLDKEMDVDGEQIEESKKLLAEALAPLVEVPARDLQLEVEKDATYSNGKPRRFLWLKREVDDSFHDRFIELKNHLRDEAKDTLKTDGKSKDPVVRAAAAKHAQLLAHALDGVGFVKSMQRSYPLGSLAGSVIGFASKYEGVDGLEHQLEYLLRGMPGQMVVTRDGLHNTLLIQDQHYTAPDVGRDVWLTINSVLQGIAEEELKKAVDEKGAECGSVVIMDPKDGRILAMANYPFFDPSHYNTADPNTRRNRSLTDPFEPGSIFKPFVMAWAIDHHVVKPTDVFYGYEGIYHDPTGRIVKDDAAYGALTVHDILVKSSNIGMTQIGWKLGIDGLYSAVTGFGFGERTGVELPGDQKGIVQARNQWSKGTLTSASFGYGVAATPLQLVRAFATFANGGYLVTPRIINAVEQTPGNPVNWTDLAGAPIQRQIISAETCATMRGIMKDVLGPQGTAKSAVSKVYPMYGKTGTAHIAAGGKGGEAGSHGYAASDYNSSFLCGAPLDNPKLVLIVTLHKPRHGYFGGTVSAPAAVAIMERSLMYMGVPHPDLPIDDKTKTTH